jgi:hypothetical protein
VCERERERERERDETQGLSLGVISTLNYFSSPKDGDY